LYPNHYYNYKRQRKQSYYEQKQYLKTQIKKLYHERGGTISYRMICDVLNPKGVTC